MSGERAGDCGDSLDLVDCLSKSGPPTPSEDAPSTGLVVSSILRIRSSSSTCHSDARPCSTNLSSTGLLLSFVTNKKNNVTPARLENWLNCQGPRSA